MKDKTNNSASEGSRNAAKEKDAVNPLPVYPAAEDIYNKSKNEENIDPENILQNKSPNEDQDSSNEKAFDDDISGEDLDIPGAELDDDNEAIGSEDEENNHYSIGGDNHNDLDEDKGE